LISVQTLVSSPFKLQAQLSADKAKSRSINVEKRTALWLLKNRLRSEAQRSGEKKKSLMLRWLRYVNQRQGSGQTLQGMRGKA